MGIPENLDDAPFFNPVFGLEAEVVALEKYQAEYYTEVDDESDLEPAIRKPIREVGQFTAVLDVFGRYFVTAFPLDGDERFPAIRAVEHDVVIPWRCGSPRPAI